MDWSGRFASSEVSVVGELQSSRTCRETMVDVEVEGTWSALSLAADSTLDVIITPTLDHRQGSAHRGNGRPDHIGESLVSRRQRCSSQNDTTLLFCLEAATSGL